MSAAEAGGLPADLVGDQSLSMPTPVAPWDDIRRAAQVMLEELVDAMPVADAAGRVIGIVTWTDLVSHVLSRDLFGVGEASGVAGVVREVPSDRTFGPARIGRSGPD